MAYSIRPLVSFERSFSQISPSDQKRIAEKLDRLALHPETIGASMKNLPPDLRGLHKIRVGDWRVFFWVDHGTQEITPYDIDRRDKAYRQLLGLGSRIKTSYAFHSQKSILSSWRSAACH
ncbi:MAG: hypothetical protein HY007_04350 [Candidatus Sungbacteria bacterium]|nr:hypothetical protein [Candidatus Sungbacteria bacterium]